MIGLDTNVLVRHLVQDDPAQVARVDHHFRRAIQSDETFYIPVVVLVELAWVLVSGYGLSRDAAAQGIDEILQTSRFEIQDKLLVRQALADWRAGHGDFPDCVIGRVALRDGCSSTVTFERGLKRNPLFTVL